MHYQPVHRKALALSYMLVLVKYYSLRKMTERGNYFIKTWSRSLLYPGLSFCLRYKKYELDVGLGEWKPTFFLLLQKLEKLDRERGEGVRQHALNMMWWTAARSGEGYGLLCRTVTKILVFVKNRSPKIQKKTHLWCLHLFFKELDPSDSTEPVIGRRTGEKRKGKKRKAGREQGKDSNPGKKRQLL